MKQIKDHNRPDRQRMSDPNSKVPRSGGQTGPRETLRGQDLRDEELEKERIPDLSLSHCHLSTTDREARRANSSSRKGISVHYYHYFLEINHHHPQSPNESVASKGGGTWKPLILASDHLPHWPPKASFLEADIHLILFTFQSDLLRII